MDNIVHEVLQNPGNNVDHRRDLGRLSDSVIKTLLDNTRPYLTPPPTRQPVPVTSPARSVQCLLEEASVLAVLPQVEESVGVTVLSFASDNILQNEWFWSRANSSERFTIVHIILELYLEWEKRSPSERLSSPMLIQRNKLVLRSDKIIDVSHSNHYHPYPGDGL